MKTDIKQLLPTNNYLGIVGANGMSASNPAATIADITGDDYVELDPVLSTTTQAAAVQTTGNRYIASANGATWVINRIYEWDGAAWIETIPVVDDVVFDIAAGFYKRYNGSGWAQFGGIVLLNNGNNSSSVSFGSKVANGVAYIKANQANKVRVNNTQMNVSGMMYVGSLTATATAQLHVSKTTGDLLLLEGVASLDILKISAAGVFTYGIGTSHAALGDYDLTAVGNVDLTATTGYAYLYAAAGIAYVEGDQGFDLRSSGLGTTGTINAPTLDVTADNANFNVGGATVKILQGASIIDAAGGAIIDAEARTAINALLARMRVTGGNGLIAD